MLRRALLSASRNRRVRRLVTTAPVSRGVVKRFVAGDGLDDAVEVTRTLSSQGLAVSLDHLGEDTTEPAQAAATAKAYLALLERLGQEGLSAGADVSVKLSAVGQLLEESMA